MPGHANLEALVGSWRLVSFYITYTDTQERIDYFGPHPPGYMVLSANGRVVFLFMRADRQPPQTDLERAALFNGMTAYTGLVRIEAADRLVTKVDLSWDPGYSGEQIRYFALDGNRLTIRTPDQTFTQTADRRVVADLVWEREA